MNNQNVIKKRSKAYTLCYIAVAVLTVLIVGCIIAAIVIGTLNTGVNPTEYSLKINGEETDALKNENGTVMVNIDKLTELLDLTKSGESAAPKYSNSLGDYVKFVNGESYAYVRDAFSASEMKVNLPAAVTANRETCLVPLDTVSAIFSGISVTVDGPSISINRRLVTGSTTKYEKVEIRAKSSDPLSMVLELTPIMEQYEKFLNPADRDAFLILANKENPLGSSYAPDDLVDLKSMEGYGDEQIVNDGAPNSQMRLYAANALKAMILQLRSEEYVNIFAQSGYRTYEYQENLFEKYVAEEMEKDSSLTRAEAEEIVLTYSAKPGTSEHQTGLCIDLIDDRYNTLENPFTKKLGMEWLAENAWKFGFILRYPEGAEDITGYSYESWHFRSVGRYHAERITALGITLEEYLEDYYAK